MTHELTVQVGTGKEQKQHHVLVELQADGRFRVVVTAADGSPDGKVVSDSLVDARRVERNDRFDGRVEGGGDGPATVSATWSLRDEPGGAQRMVDVDGTGPDWKVTVDGGEAMAIKIQDARAAALKGGAASDGGAAGDVRAAMPGKVVKLLCKVGDVVKAGQGLLVIEAMKMENELRAAGAGKVAEIAVKEGQTVDGGQLLLSVTAA